MAPSLEVAALRRLARVYRRIMLLTIPAAVVGCQGGGDALAPESPDAAGQAAVPVADGGLPALTSARLAFVSDMGDEAYDLFTLGLGGGKLTHLTTFAGPELRPTWSPDHKRLAFERWRNNKSDIYLMNADGSNKHWALPTQSAWALGHPSWSPDGTNLLVQIHSSYSNATYVGRIDLASGKLSFLAPAGYYNQPGRYPVYNKDGTWIYYITGGPPTTPGSSSTFQIRVFKPYGPDTGYAWLIWDGNDLTLSPDGTKLALDLPYYGSTQRDIEVFDLKTGTSKRLTTAGSNEIHPAWSPDGTQLAFASDRSGSWQIYTMNAATGGNVQKITSMPGGAADPSWYR